MGGGVRGAAGNVIITTDSLYTWSRWTGYRGGGGVDVDGGVAGQSTRLVGVGSGVRGAAGNVIITTDG